MTASVNRKILLAIDNVSLPLRRNLVLHLNHPRVRAEPVLRPRRDDPAAPDQLATIFYGTVLHDQGHYRMWYHPVAKGVDLHLPPHVKRQLNPKSTLDMTTGPICYAESIDGLEWTRPALKLHSYKGRLDNNAIPMGDLAITIGAAVIRDDDDPDRARRYKAVFNYYDYQPGTTPAEHSGAMRTAVSPDGLKWTIGPRDPIGSFFEANGFYRFNGQYIVVGQKAGSFAPSEGGHNSGRQAYAHLSIDFTHWESAHAEALLLPEPLNPADRGLFKPYDQVHVGVASMPYPNVCVGLFGLWHNNSDFREIGCDLGLAVSNDGIHYRQPAKGIPYISQFDSPMVGADPHGATKLTQGSGILNVGDQTRIYHARWTEGRIAGICSEEAGWGFHPEYIDDYYAEIALATIERDRWGSLEIFPDQAEGHVISAPIQLPNDMADFKLTLNAAGTAGLTVSILETNFRPIEQYANGHCVDGDGLDAAVSWSTNLKPLAGRTVRFRINAKRQDRLAPKVYAINVNGIT
jgi:hypothetical protein